MTYTAHQSRGTDGGNDERAYQAALDDAFPILEKTSAMTQFLTDVLFGNDTAQSRHAAEAKAEDYKRGVRDCAKIVRTMAQAPADGLKR